MPREVRIAMRKSQNSGKQKRREQKQSKLRFEDELMHELEENEVIDVPSDEEGRVQLAMALQVGVGVVAVVVLIVVLVELSLLECFVVQGLVIVVVLHHLIQTWRVAKGPSSLGLTPS